MSANVTVAQIRAAQADISGYAANDLIRDLEPRLAEHAAKAAGRMGTGNYALFLDEFMQVARIHALDCIARFDAETVEEFYRFLSRSVSEGLRDAVAEERYGDRGVGRVAMWTFGKMVELAEGDVFKAEKLAQTEPEKGFRMSPERAQAAREAWMGTASLDIAPNGGQTWGDVLTAAADDHNVDEGASPVYGVELIRFAAEALEPHTVLPADETARHAVQGALASVRLGSVSGEDINTLSEAVRVPADDAQRRAVTEAFNLLAAAARAAHLAPVPSDDYAAPSEKGVGVGARMEKRYDVVREVLASLSPSMRVPMELWFGITGDQPVSRTVDLAEMLGKSVPATQKGLSAGKKKFAELYSARITDDPAEREALMAAMKSRRTKNGK